MKKHASTILLAAAGLAFAGVLAWCLFQFHGQYTEDAEAQAVFDELAQVVLQASAIDQEQPEDEQAAALLEVYEELSYTNPDMIGWVSIPGTTINYPVMHTPEDPDRYLTRDFYGNPSAHGVPYLSASCTLDSDHLIIYGHHIQGYKMFGALMYYTSRAYWAAHPYIQFDTLEVTATYQIIAVIQTTVGAFPYYEYTDFTSEEEFNQYIQTVKSLVLYDTGITTEYGDQFLTLSTCEYSVRNGRLAVIAKRA